MKLTLKELRQKLRKTYSESMVKQIIVGKRKPSRKNIYKLFDEDKRVVFDIWRYDDPREYFKEDK